MTSPRGQETAHVPLVQLSAILAGLMTFMAVTAQPLWRSEDLVMSLVALQELTVSTAVPLPGPRSMSPATRPAGMTVVQVASPLAPRPAFRTDGAAHSAAEAIGSSVIPLIPQMLTASSAGKSGMLSGRLTAVHLIMSAFSSLGGSASGQNRSPPALMAHTISYMLPKPLPF